MRRLSSAIGYVVLAVAFVLESIPFRQSIRQAGPEAESMQRDLIEYVLATSDPTLRAVFVEDAAAFGAAAIQALLASPDVSAPRPHEHKQERTRRLTLGG